MFAQGFGFLRRRLMSRFRKEIASPGSRPHLKIILVLTEQISGLPEDSSISP